MSIYNDFDYLKRITGILIKYYRKQSKEKVVDFLINKKEYYHTYCLRCMGCSNPSIICSKKTLYALERGEISKNDCYYYRLCEKINKRILFDRQILNQLLNYRIALVGCIVSMSKSKLHKLYTQIKNDLVYYENVIYISDILRLYHDMIEFYLYHTIPQNHLLDLYAYLFPHLLEDDKKLITLLLYDVSFRSSSLKLTRNEIVNQGKLFISDPLFYRFRLEQIVQKNFLDAYEILEKEEFPKIKELSSYHQCCLLEYKAFVLMNSESYEKCYNLLRECIHIATKNNDFSDYVITNYYGKFGMICFLLERYEEVVQSFKRLLDNHAVIGAKYSLLFYSLEKCNKTEQIRKVLDTIDQKEYDKPFVRYIIAYYHAKYTNKDFTRKDYILLEDIICKDIKPFLDRYGEIQKAIFTEELKQCIEKTGNYKKYYLFTEK